MNEVYVKKSLQLLGLDLSESDLQLIGHSIRLVEYRRQEFILREGDELREVYLVLKGITRGYFIDIDGNEITRCFAAEGGLFWYGGS